jgi:hypothetical protein
MNKIEKSKRIDSLDDLKRTRYNTGTLFYFIGIFIMATLDVLMCSFAILFIAIRIYYYSFVFAILGLIFFVIQMWMIYKQEAVEEKFLLKYGKNN